MMILSVALCFMGDPTTRGSGFLRGRVTGGRGSDLIGAGVRCGQPAEEAFVRGGRVLARRPVARHVVRVGDHQLPSVQVRTEDKWDVLHPPDDSASLRGNLRVESRTWSDQSNRK